MLYTVRLCRVDREIENYENIRMMVLSFSFGILFGAELNLLHIIFDKSVPV